MYCEKFEAKLIENIKRLKSDADFLHANGRFRSALFMLISSYEETMKLQMHYTDQEKPKKAHAHNYKFRKLTESKDIFVKLLTEKPEIMIRDLAKGRPTPEDHEKFVKFLCDGYDVIMDFPSLRQRVLYADKSHLERDPYLDNEMFLDGSFKILAKLAANTFELVVKFKGSGQSVLIV